MLQPADERRQVSDLVERGELVLRGVFEGTRSQYLAGLPPDVAARVPAESWQEDWRVMRLPGRMDTQRALIADDAHYVARLDAIAEYLARRQPPS